MKRATPTFCCGHLHIDFLGVLLETVALLFRERLHAVGEPLHQRRIAIVRDQRGEHLHVAPRRAVDAALVRPVDVGLHRPPAPRFAARGQLEVHAPFRSAANAGAAARRLIAAFADQRVDVREEVRVILHELAQSEIHPLFVALGDEHEVHRQRTGDRLDGHQRVPVGELRPLRVGRAAPDHHLLVRRLFHQARLERRRRPRIGLRDRHRVVLPVDGNRARRAVVAFRVHDRIARRAPFSDADVVDPRGLAPELLEEALDHLRRLGNPLAAVRDAGLSHPLLQVLDVLVDVIVDVAVHLLQFVGHLAQIRLDGFVAGRANAEFGFRRGRRRRRLLLGRAFRTARSEQRDSG